MGGERGTGKEQMFRSTSSENLNSIVSEIIGRRGWFYIERTL